MFGASLLKAVKYLAAGLTFTGGEVTALAVACVTAFLVSVAAIKFLVGFVKKHDFKPFGWYRIVLGTVVLAAALLGF